MIEKTTKIYTVKESNAQFHDWEFNSFTEADRFIRTEAPDIWPVSTHAILTTPTGLTYRYRINSSQRANEARHF